MNDEPFILYKFRSINKLFIESLVNPSLYFARPDTLNDPFDCRIDLRRAFERAASSATGNRKDFLSSALDAPVFLENWKSTFDDIGVCAFSRINSHPLLWSHYADAHRGVCLTYQFRPSDFLTTDFHLTAAGNVEYSAEPLTGWLKDAPMEMTRFVEGLVHKYLKSKSPAWEYEQEARIIRHTHGVFNFRIGDRSGPFLSEVCFGLRTPQADIDLVTKLAREYSGCMRFSQLIRDETEFGFAVKAL